MIKVTCDICETTHDYYSSKYVTLEIKYYQKEITGYHFCAKDCAPTVHEVGDMVVSSVDEIKRKKIIGEESL